MEKLAIGSGPKPHMVVYPINPLLLEGQVIGIVNIVPLDAGQHEPIICGRVVDLGPLATIGPRRITAAPGPTYGEDPPLWQGNIALIAPWDVHLIRLCPYTGVIIIDTGLHIGDPTGGKDPAVSKVVDTGTEHIMVGIGIAPSLHKVSRRVEYLGRRLAIAYLLESKPVMGGPGQQLTVGQLSSGYRDKVKTNQWAPITIPFRIVLGICIKV
ncbi:hypothetical protein ACOCEA_17840, partial [Maribacter sp. CXY002]|uniref:hypothetical protein n=1 Tax=Maribacter luteocoastalis TaxID=3407671 RepID=UPI003B675CE3